MMLKIDFTSIVGATKKPKGLIITSTMNWLVKPFTMYLITAFFLKVVFQNFIPTNLADEYLAGAVLLGAAPCTAMVFVWSHLNKGDPAYTLVQVAVNNIILLIAFTPIVAILLGITDVFVPYDTLILSVILLIVIPLVGGYLSRKFPLHVLLIAILLTIQTFLIFALTYGWAKAWKLPHNIAAPAGMIGASNFFELAVAVAIANRTRHWFPKESFS